MGSNKMKTISFGLLYNSFKNKITLALVWSNSPILFIIAWSSFKVHQNKGCILRLIALGRELYILIHETFGQENILKIDETLASALHHAQKWKIILDFSILFCLFSRA